MKPRKNADFDQLQLFNAQFSQLLNPDHPLVHLADKIDWPRFETAFSPCFSSDNGAPALATRLVVGLLYLKHAFNLSDEALVERWVENPYWQYFCGFKTMQHELPLHPTSLVKWRQRVGADRLAELLKETVAIALVTKQISTEELAKVNVDTTVQEKNITFPTDSKLLLRAIEKLAKAAKKRGIRLRQTYTRVAKKVAVQASRYAHAKQFKRMQAKVRKLKTWLGRVLRDIRRQVPEPSKAFEKFLKLCERLHTQERNDSGKLYSLHEPEVVCISKGKVAKRYEFGQKIAIVTSNRYNFIVGAQLVKGNPFDGHTLAQSLDHVKTITGVDVKTAYVDKGYRGHGYTGSATIRISGAGGTKLSAMERKRCKRRSAIEPKIGHMKAENRLSRCYLRGLTGDAINAILAAAGSNLRKLMRGLFFELIFRVLRAFKGYFKRGVAPGLVA